MVAGILLLLTRRPGAVVGCVVGGSLIAFTYLVLMLELAGAEGAPADVSLWASFTIPLLLIIRCPTALSAIRIARGLPPSSPSGNARLWWIGPMACMLGGLLLSLLDEVLIPADRPLLERVISLGYGMIVGLLVGIVGSIPGIIARKRKVRNRLPINVLGYVGLAFLVLPWIGALIWACVDPREPG
jgi:hypothetical protein